MAQSRQRHKHSHHHVQHPPGPGGKHKAQTKALNIMMIFMGILGVFVAYISAGPELLWLAAGAVAGIAAGFFIGRSMDNVAGRK
jgi:uncharacterized membrane protein